LIDGIFSPPPPEKVKEKHVPEDNGDLRLKDFDEDVALSDSISVVNNKEDKNRHPRK